MAKVLYGSGGGEQINASADKTQVYGLKGNDTLTSDNKSDVLLVGGSGDDRLIMTGGNGTLSGGAGNNTFEFVYSADKKVSALIEDLEPASDKIIINFDGDTQPQLSSSTSGNDVVWQSGDGNFNLTLKSVRDNDYFDDEASDEIWKVLELTNAEREKENLPALTLSDGLIKGASIRAEEITELGEVGLLINHTRRPDDEESFETVFEETGKTYLHFAENLDGGARTAKTVVEQWMASDSHKTNILNPVYKKIGVGYNENDTDKSDHRWYWTQLFGDSLEFSETVSAASLLNANLEINAVKKFIAGDDSANTLENADYGVTIEALGGNDSISNAGAIVSISGGADNDTIDNSGSFVTINAGKGADIISLASDAEENVIEYKLGDGADTIFGIHTSDFISITGGEFTFAKTNGNIIINVGTDSITVADATIAYVEGDWSRFFIGTEGNDTIDNLSEGALTIQALGGNDSISNYGYDNVSINGGMGSDTIENFGKSVTILGGNEPDYIKNIGGDNSIIDAGFGYDIIDNSGSNVSISGGYSYSTISNSGSNVTIDGDRSNDYIFNRGASVTIDAGSYYDTINNTGSSVSISGGISPDSIYSWNSNNVTIDAGAQEDTVNNYSSNTSIDGGAGNDSIRNAGSFVTITGGEDDDTISSWNVDNVTIDGGNGNDSIDAYATRYGGSNLSINGGEGNDTISNKTTLSNDITINGGKGDDSIDARGLRTLIEYASGDGNDTISNFGSSDTLSISGGEYIRHTLANDLVFTVGMDSIFLLDATTLSADINVIGEGSEGSFISGLITLSEGNDTYHNRLKDATVQAQGGDDSITNDAMKVSINGGADNDTINNSGERVTILGDAGNDSIANNGDSITIDTGLGDDIISLSSDAKKILIKYLPGDGSDSIFGFSENATLEINSVTGGVSTLTNDDNLIFSVGADSITIFDAASLDSANIIVKWLEQQDKFVALSESNDDYTNTKEGATVAALGGNDEIDNEGSFASISGGAGNDSIYNLRYFTRESEDLPYDALTPDNATLDGGEGNDYIRNHGSNVSINGGEGDDEINNTDATWNEETLTPDKATIDGGEGNDDIYNLGSQLSITGGAGKDTISNKGSFVTITGGGGDDSIRNNGETAISEYHAGDALDTQAAQVSIFGGEGNDDISNSGSFVTIDGGAGNDKIDNGDLYNVSSHDVTIIGGEGDDTIKNTGSNVSISGGKGNDSISNFAITMTYDTEHNEISIKGASKTVTIEGGEGDDTISSRGGSNILIYGGEDNDSINNFTSNVTILGGTGNDTICNQTSTASFDVINGGAGDDYIENWGENTTIVGGTGKDLISLSSTSKDNVINYTSGDGNDTILGFSSNTTINVRGERIYSGKVYDTVGSGNDIIIKVGEGSIRLVDARNKPLPIIIGESGTSGGTGSTSSNSGNSGSSGTSGTSGSGGGNTSGGTSSSEGNNSAASGGFSASGSSGTATSANSSSGNVIRQTSSSTATPTFVNFTIPEVPATSSDNSNFANESAPPNDEQPLPQKISLPSFPTDLNYPSASEVNSAAQNSGQLWGDAGDDTLFGGEGQDIFIGGKTQGSDTFLNVSADDIVYLNDVILKDISDINKDGDTIRISLDNGNVFTIQSSDTVSGAVVLADSTWHFRHTT